MGGSKFTYMERMGKSFSKLDRFFVCEQVHGTWPEATVMALPRRASDHNPILLKLSKDDFGPCPFKLYGSWLKHPEFDTVVKNCLAEFDVGREVRADRRLLLKFKSLKGVIKAWRVKVNKENMLSRDKAIETCSYLEEQAVVGPLSIEDHKRWGEALITLKKIEDERMTDQAPTYTLDEALVAVGFGKFQGWLIVYAGLGSIAEAMEVMILSFIGPSVRSEWNLSSTEESLITTVVFAGMLIGAYSWGFISDNFGRRKGLLSIAIVTSGASVLSAFSPNYISLVVLRCIGGIGLGGGPTYNSWFLEFIPAPSRGLWMVIFATFWTVGTIVEASLAWIIMPRYGWRWLLAISSIPALAALVFYQLVPESPRYLCLKGQPTEAYDILKRISVVNQRQLPSGILLSDQINCSDEDLDTTLEDTRLLSPKRNKSASKTSFSSLWMLFSSNLRKTTFLLWIVFFGNSFAYYGIILLTSELSNRHGECTSFALVTDNSSEDSTYRDVFITSLAEVPGLVFAAFIVDRIGRKHSMELMFFIGFIFLLPLLSLQSDISTMVSLFGSRMFIIGTFTIANIYAPEIYPTAVRATGVGIASSVSRIGGMISPLVAVHLVDDCHQTAAIVLFEVVIILSGLCVMFFPHETMARELADTVSEPTLS
ncbi:hypothetical protein SSX86_026374 [Deinandra increscens subsp. villosa]|uniref:Major facilitator superfamily (MFS) profile domain-containing protein n=1 Tax=Deinandra increscens subsp. villosa TaxID=3103831 RepID=A0AAP0CJG6_9ASTR